MAEATTLPPPSPAAPPPPATAPARRRDPLTRHRMGLVRVLQYACLAVVVLGSIIPLYWIVLNAFRVDSEIAAYPPTFLPRSFTMEHFTSLFEVYGFQQYLINSMLVSTTATAAALVLGVMAAYGMSRFRYRAVRAVGELSLLAYLLPPILVLVPITQILIGNGLGDNRVALAVLYAATLLPFALWILRSYFNGLGIETEEAAMIDGCTRFGAFIRVVLPQALPGIVSTAIFTFNAAWSEYLFASTLMTSNEKLPANPAIFLLMGHMGTESWGLLMAAAITIILPVLVLFFMAQRWLVSGLTEGAVKG
ncbi:carbohydrate ABC transporter permease [Ornithinimicrobium cavernae]|uniref:carbohydrate ABC transporter permease n=1 Tax=Ornithinimicrobium cavernae TaxID=2666047 RepID=UPI00192A4777|nr:carbohydrate ABC transporter permease [Ornithinimicrobium cavernae]